MNNKIAALGIQAGFVPWGDESWNPGDVFDWSSRYDAELEKFYILLVESCIGSLENKLEAVDHMYTSEDYKNGIKDSIKQLRNIYVER